MTIGMDASKPRADEVGKIVTFFQKQVKNDFESNKLGSPVFKDVLFVDIVIPAVKDAHVLRPCREADKYKYPQAWERYTERKDRVIEGVHLENWPLIGREQIAVLNSFNIFTVEDVASLSETGMANMGMGARDLVEAAKKFIDSMLAPAEMNKKINSIKEDYDDTVGSLKEEIDKLKSQLEPKKKRGRPKKDDTVDIESERSAPNGDRRGTADDSGEQQHSSEETASAE